jgi:short-subunit dehydrogenase
MIERKRGHIVSVSSACVKMSVCLMIAYCTTKFGNDGLMKALYNDLCVHGHDEYIKTTTVYLSYIKTQDKLVKTTNIADESTSVFETDYAADLIVRGVLLNRRQFMVPPEFDF